MNTKKKLTGKIVHVLLFFLIVFALTGCGKENDLSGAAGGNSGGGQGNTNTSKPEVITDDLIDLNDPQVFLPKPYCEYTYYMHYVDGEEGREKWITAPIDGFSLVSQACLLDDGEGYVTHYLDGPEGVYDFVDADFQKAQHQWLIFNPVLNSSWEDNGRKRTIVELDKHIELGWIAFSGCVVIREDWTEAGYSFLTTYAPGYGIVLETDTGGNETMRLESVRDVNKGEALQTVRDLSPVVLKYLGG